MSELFAEDGEDEVLATADEVTTFKCPLSDHVRYSFPFATKQCLDERVRVL